MDEFDGDSLVDDERDSVDAEFHEMYFPEEEDEHDSEAEGEALVGPSRRQRHRYNLRSRDVGRIEEDRTEEEDEMMKNEEKKKKRRRRNRHRRKK